MVNKVILIGNVGQDPKVDLVGQGTKKATFSLATSERFKKQGETVEETQWHNIVAWSGLAEFIDNHVVKGSKLYVEGKLQHRNYEDNEGNKKYVTEIIAREMKFVGSKQDNG
jgi:single-strand DNA-binding protein